MDAHPEYYGKMSQPKNPEAAVTEAAPAVTEAPAAEVAPVETAPAPVKTTSIQSI